MPFKAVVLSLDELEDENLRENYKEVKVRGVDGKEKPVYALELDGVDSHPSVLALRNAHERQKSETAKAKARVAELESKTKDVPDDFSIDEWNRLRTVDDEWKKNPGNPEAKRLHDAEVQSVRAMFEQKLNNQKTTLEAMVKAEQEKHATTRSSLRNRLVNDDLTKALVEAGVDKKYLAATRALLEKSVKVVDTEEGGMSALFETDMGEQPIDQFVPQWAQSDLGKHFLVPAQGSGASGGDRSGTNFAGPNPWSNAGWNMTQQAQIFAKDPAKADRMAKSAGHVQAVGSKREHAK